MDEQPFEVIIGSQLDSVKFFQDYVQLYFDGPCLSAFTSAEVKERNIHLRWGMDAYRDALCGRIAKIVVKAGVVEGVEIFLEFSDHSRITISLRREDYVREEAANFVYEDDNGRLYTLVW